MITEELKNNCKYQTDEKQVSSFPLYNLRPICKYRSQWFCNYRESYEEDCILDRFDKANASLKKREGGE